jgi:transcriptional regulator with XRE-family HTH domain
VTELTAGERIRHWRRLRGWTICQLAAAADLNKSKVHRLETGGQHVRDADLRAITSALGISMPEFYGGGPQHGRHGEARPGAAVKAAS